MSLESRVERLEAEMQAVRTDISEIRQQNQQGRERITDTILDMKTEIIIQINGLRTEIGDIQGKIARMEREISKGAGTGEIVIHRRRIVEEDEGGEESSSEKEASQITFKERTLYIIAILLAAGVVGANKLLDVALAFLSRG